MNAFPNVRHLGNALLVIAALGALLAVAGTSLRPGNLACVSNAAALNLALSEYVQDHDERFPPTDSVPAFQSALAPYVRSQSVYTCPVTGADYKPNAALSFASPFGSGRDPGGLEAFQDGMPHADGLPTVCFLDGHIERGGVDQADAETASVNDAKRLALVIQQYAQDNDGTLPPMQTPAQMQAAIFPYLGTRRYFRSPVTGLAYTPNPALSGRSEAAVPAPANTELLRDPRRHRDGKSVVAYADGHVMKQ